MGSVPCQQAERVLLNRKGKKECGSEAKEKEVIYLWQKKRK